jgi:hypothetical protein
MLFHFGLKDDDLWLSDNDRLAFYTIQRGRRLKDVYGWI